MELRENKYFSSLSEEEKRWTSWLKLNTSTRLFNVLRRRQLLTRDAILRMDEQDLRRTRNAGENTMEEFRSLRDRLAEMEQL